MRQSVKTSGLFWFFFIALILLEFIGFYIYAHANITPFYPANFDQASFLPIVYAQYEKIKHAGFIHGFLSSEGLATGPLFIWQTAPWFLLFGASRFSALSLNFFYFAVLQIIVLLTLRRFTRRWYFSVLIIGLLLLMRVPFNSSGGLFDFRVDFMAFCLYGIVATLVLNSRVFLSRGRTLVAAFAAGALVLLRVITSAYLFAVFFALLILGLIYLRWAKGPAKADIKMRIKNLLIYQLIVFLFIAPFLWVSRLALYNYYIVFHVISNEKNIREAAVGVHDWIEALFFYPYNVLRSQIGLHAIAWVVGLLILGAYLSFIYRKAIKQSVIANIFSEGSLYLLLAILIPLCVLTTDTSKSAVVGSIVVVPIVWLTVWLVMAPVLALKSSRFLTIACAVLSVLVFVFAMSYQTRFYAHSMRPVQKQKLEQINRMYNDVGHYIVKHKLPRVNLSVDQLQGYLTWASIKVFYYEQHHVMLNINIEQLGGNSVSPISYPEAIKSLKKSNMVIFQASGPKPAAYYPFNTSVEKMKPKLMAYIHQYFLPLETYPIGKRNFTVFVRKNAKGSQ